MATKIISKSEKRVTTWIIVGLVLIGANSSFNFKRFQEIIAHSRLAWNWVGGSNSKEMNEADKAIGQ